MVQTGAGMSRFQFSCECKMQMTPSCDSFMTAVDSLHCSQGRDPVTPIRQPNLLSDLLHIGSIIQKAHQSCTHFSSTLVLFSLSLPFLALKLLSSTCIPPLPTQCSCVLCPLHFIYHPFLPTSTYPLHLTSRSPFTRNHCFPLIWLCLPLWMVPPSPSVPSLWDNSVLPRNTDEKLVQGV